MQAMKYSQWKETAHLLHMALQMMGKAKLGKMAPQPEWNQALLAMTPSGFTTGLIPDGQSCFEITIDVIAGEMAARCTTGRSAGFRLGGSVSVGEVYAAFGQMLENIGHQTRLNPTPQECANQTLFHQQQEALRYDTAGARNYFACCTLAYSAILDFSAPFRCKKIQPSMFWGTFDMTAVLFSGEEEPFGGGGKIERVAFDEKLVEFGFWPGDDKQEEPNFFVLAYPFMAAHPEGFALRPEGAFFSPEKKEYFLPLAKALAAPDALAAITAFCTDALAAVLAQNKWQHAEWFTKPLA